MLSMKHRAKYKEIKISQILPLRYNHIYQHIVPLLKISFTNYMYVFTHIICIWRETDRFLPAYLSKELKTVKKKNWNVHSIYHG